MNINGSNEPLSSTVIQDNCSQYFGRTIHDRKDLAVIIISNEGDNVHVTLNGHMDKGDVLYGMKLLEHSFFDNYEVGK